MAFRDAALSFEMVARTSVVVNSPLDAEFAWETPPRMVDYALMR
jgi:hypothetical protein